MFNDFLIATMICIINFCFIKSFIYLKNSNNEYDLNIINSVILKCSCGEYQYLAVIIKDKQY